MKKLILATCLCVFLSAFAFGQANNATLTGTVADASGAILPGVSITATNTATGVMTQSVTNEAGAYTMLGLIPGTYNVTGELPGFQKQNYTNVAL